jgi:N-acetyl sugar amidotransferase
MRYCNECVQPDTRPKIRFSGDGACYACLHAHKRRLGGAFWGVRQTEIERIVREAKRRIADYDCVIGVSGGKDSTVQSFYARDVLGLRCLLVNCAPENITGAGRANLENLRQHGFDLIIYKPDPVIMRRLVKASFYEYGNPIKPTEYPLFAVTFQTAVRFGIPLVILGENPGVTLGVGGLGDGGDAAGIVDSNTLAGGSLEPWLLPGISERDLALYKFPDRTELEEAGVKAVYLAHYMKDWSFHKNAKFARKKGLVGRANHSMQETGRLSAFSAVDSDMQIVNQMLKYLKFGFGFVTDEVCYAIRDGLMDRETGIGMVEMYDGRCGQKYVTEFCEYVGIRQGEFWDVAGRWANPELFERTGPDSFKPKFKVGEGLVDG